MIVRDSRDVMDGVGLVATVGVWADVVPIVVGMLTAIWFLIRIFEWARVALFGHPPRGPFDPPK